MIRVYYLRRQGTREISIKKNLANFIFALFHYYVHICFRFSTYIYNNLVVYVHNMTLLMICINVVSFVLVQLAEIRQVYRLSYGNYPPVKAAMLDTVD